MIKHSPTVLMDTFKIHMESTSVVSRQEFKAQQVQSTCWFHKHTFLEKMKD